MTGQIPLSVISWLECIWKADLPPNSKYLCAYIRTFMNEKQDVAWPSYTRIIAETGLSRSTVSKYFGILEAENWLLRKRGDSKKNTRYTANVPKKVLDNLIEGSTPHELRSTPHELGVVRHAHSNKQYNKQSNIQVGGEVKKTTEFHNSIMDLFNSILGKPLGKILEISPERKKHLTARIKDNKRREDIQWWEDYFTFVSGCPHLVGQSPPRENGKIWKASFDWLINPNNMIKVIEGKYEQ